MTTGFIRMVYPDPGFTFYEMCSAYPDVLNGAVRVFSGIRSTGEILDMTLHKDEAAAVQFYKDIGVNIEKIKSRTKRSKHK